jgi:hypothetical protein
MEVNNNFLRITGSVNIPVPLDIDTDYAFVGNISVYKEEKGSNQDGTFNVVYKAMFTDSLSLIKGEQSIPAKNKTTQSQMLRSDCRKRGIEYDEFIPFLRHPELLEELFTRFEQT